MSITWAPQNDAVAIILSQYPKAQQRRPEAAVVSQFSLRFLSA
ncbi:MAG: hypothetical protein R3Y10_12260 [Ferrimonas sp.]